jgi:hypothetical protein
MHSAVAGEGAHLDHVPSAGRGDQQAEQRSLLGRDLHDRARAGDAPRLFLELLKQGVVGRAVGQQVGVKGVVDRCVLAHRSPQSS